MIKVVIYDDNQSRLESLRLLLEAYERFEVAGTFVNCSSVAEQMERLQPDVVLMDIQMPVADGISGVKVINELFPNIKIIMQTVFEDDDKIFDALRFGASGYLLKRAEPIKIVEAIDDVLSGGSPMSPSIATRVLHFFRKRQEISTTDYGLSEREKDILHELVEGNSYKMIAEKLQISYHTVNSHIKKIYDKLQVHSIGEAVSLALQKNIVR